MTQIDISSLAGAVIAPIEPTKNAAETVKPAATPVKKQRAARSNKGTKQVRAASAATPIIDDLYFCIKSGSTVEWHKVESARIKNLSDAINSVLDASGDTAATPKAVKTAYDLAKSASNKSKSADKLTTARKISLTGDASGSASFDGSANVSIKAALADSGVTAGTYGPTGDASLAFGGSFVVGSVTVDKKGRVTSAVGRNLKLPAAPTSVSGNAGSATKLQNARTILINLASDTAASFNGTANVTPGVSGTLPTKHGGTGRTDGIAVNVTQKKSLTEKGDIGYGTNDGYLVDVSALSFWDGAYWGDRSNLTYCANGFIVGTTGNQTIADDKTFSGTTTLNGSTVTKNIDCNGNVDISGTLALHGKLTASGGGALTGAWTCPTPTSNTQLANKAYVDDVIKTGSSVPTGCIIAWMGSSSAIPRGFLLCNGANVSRTTYKNLFNAIGTTYGKGDGSETFTLPKLNDGRFLEGSTSAGTKHDAGLPNISGGITNKVGVVLWWDDNTSSATGAFSVSAKYRSAPNGESNQTTVNSLKFSASRSSSIYSGSTVQPAALTCLYVIKF